MIKLAFIIILCGLLTYDLEPSGFTRLSYNKHNENFKRPQGMSNVVYELIRAKTLKPVNNGGKNAVRDQSFIKKSIVECGYFWQNTVSQANTQIVRCSTLVEVFKAEKNAGYDMLTTTNAGRMQAGVILRLVKAALEKNLDGPLLFISHEDYFAAYLKTMGLTKKEAPLFAQKSFQHQQNQLIEYTKSKVIKNIKKGRKPLVAITVRAWWKKGLDLPNFFSYDDTLTNPNLKVINERVINFRLLDFGDQIVFDQIQGIKGCPTSGALGLIFKGFRALGLYPSVVQTCMTVSNDNLLILSAKFKFLGFKITLISTIYPDGHAIIGLPDDRADLKEIKKRLEYPLEIEYYPYRRMDE